MPTPNADGLLGCLGLVVIDLKGDQPAQFCVLFSNWCRCRAGGGVHLSRVRTFPMSLTEREGQRD